MILFLIQILNIISSFSPINISTEKAISLLRKVLLEISPNPELLSTIEQFYTKYWTNEENFVNFSKTELGNLFTLVFVEYHNNEFAQYLNNVFFEMIPTNEYSCTNYKSVFNAFSEAIRQILFIQM